MTNANNAAANQPKTVSTKPCANCGDKIPVGGLMCAPCWRETHLNFRKTHAHLFENDRTY
jgi:hypothetical protein